MEEAVAHAKQSRAYRRWHPESLDAFLMGAVQQSSDGTVRLTTPLLHEAAFYCHVAINYTEDQLARVRCPVVFEYGSHTGLCNLFGIRELVDALPERFTLAEPLEQYSHQMIVEAPDECAERILMRLKRLRFFIQHHNRLQPGGADQISRL
jgi:pimeloyl-ACP methyl ester carboxylesterase